MSPPARPRAPLAGAPAATGVIVATAPGEGDGPAAMLPWEGATVVRRLAEQLADLGVQETHVITRPAWEAQVRAALQGARAEVHACATVAEDLAAAARIARSGQDGVVLAYGDIVTQREALAGLLADPRLGTAVLTTSASQGRPFVWRMRSMRGRVVSSASPFHAIRRSRHAFLGVMKIAAADRATLAEVAQRLSELSDGALPPSWEEELAGKQDRWRMYLANRAERAADHAEADAEGDAEAHEVAEDEDAVPLSARDLVLDPDDEAEVRRRLAAAPDDSTAMLLVGMIRSGTRIGNSFIRGFYWARPLTPADVDRAAQDITQVDEEKLLLNSAVKANDGFFTTYFVSPYSKYIARWAARRGLSPNTVTTISLLIGILAGAAFAEGSRAGLIAGAVLLQIAFTTDCVDGQLARYTRTFSKLGAWLDSVFDRAKEYIVFAGLAIGASRTGDPVWVLAGAALTLQTMRHTIIFSYSQARHQDIAAVRHPPLDQASDDPLGRPPRRPFAAAATPAAPPPAAPPMSLPHRVVGAWHAIERVVPGARWVKKMIALPIGERFALISLTAAIGGPRTTFVALLVWGGFAAFYTLVGRTLRSIAR